MEETMLEGQRVVGVGAGGMVPNLEERMEGVAGQSVPGKEGEKRNGAVTPTKSPRAKRPLAGNLAEGRFVILASNSNDSCSSLEKEKEEYHEELGKFGVVHSSFGAPKEILPSMSSFDLDGAARDFFAVDWRKEEGEELCGVASARDFFAVDWRKEEGEEGERHEWRETKGERSWFVAETEWGNLAAWQLPQQDESYMGFNGKEEENALDEGHQGSFMALLSNKRGAKSEKERAQGVPGADWGSHEALPLQQEQGSSEAMNEEKGEENEVEDGHQRSFMSLLTSREGRTQDKPGSLEVEYPQADEEELLPTLDQTPEEVILHMASAEPSLSTDISKLTESMHPFLKEENTLRSSAESDKSLGSSSAVPVPDPAPEEDEGRALENSSEGTNWRDPTTGFSSIRSLTNEGKGIWWAKEGASPFQDAFGFPGDEWRPSSRGLEVGELGLVAAGSVDSELGRGLANGEWWRGKGDGTGPVTEELGLLAYDPSCEAEGGDIVVRSVEEGLGHTNSSTLLEIQGSDRLWVAASDKQAGAEQTQTGSRASPPRERDAARVLVAMTRRLMPVRRLTAVPGEEDLKRLLALVEKAEEKISLRESVGEKEGGVGKGGQRDGKGERGSRGVQGMEEVPLPGDERDDKARKGRRGVQGIEVVPFQGDGRGGGPSRGQLTTDPPTWRCKSGSFLIASMPWPEEDRASSDDNVESNGQGLAPQRSKSFMSHRESVSQHPKQHQPYQHGSRSSRINLRLSKTGSRHAHSSHNLVSIFSPMVYHSAHHDASKTSMEGLGFLTAGEASSNDRPRFVKSRLRAGVLEATATSKGRAQDARCLNFGLASMLLGGAGMGAMSPELLEGDGEGMGVRALEQAPAAGSIRHDGKTEGSYEYGGTEGQQENSGHWEAGGEERWESFVAGEDQQLQLHQEHSMGARVSDIAGNDVPPLGDGEEEEEEALADSLERSHSQASSKGTRKGWKGLIPRFYSKGRGDKERGDMGRGEDGEGEEGGGEDGELERGGDGGVSGTELTRTASAASSKGSTRSKGEGKRTGFWGGSMGHGGKGEQEEGEEEEGKEGEEEREDGAHLERSQSHAGNRSSRSQTKSWLPGIRRKREKKGGQKEEEGEDEDETLSMRSSDVFSVVSAGTSPRHTEKKRISIFGNKVGGKEKWRSSRTKSHPASKTEYVSADMEETEGDKSEQEEYVAAAGGEEAGETKSGRRESFLASLRPFRFLKAKSQNAAAARKYSREDVTLSHDAEHVHFEAETGDWRSGIVDASPLQQEEGVEHVPFTEKNMTERGGHEVEVMRHSLSSDWRQRPKSADATSSKSVLVKVFRRKKEEGSSSEEKGDAVEEESSAWAQAEVAGERDSFSPPALIVSVSERSKPKLEGEMFEKEEKKEEVVEWGRHEEEAEGIGGFVLKREYKRDRRRASELGWGWGALALQGEEGGVSPAEKTYEMAYMQETGHEEPQGVDAVENASGTQEPRGTYIQDDQEREGLEVSREAKEEERGYETDSRWGGSVRDEGELQGSATGKKKGLGSTLGLRSHHRSLKLGLSGLFEMQKFQSSTGTNGNREKEGEGKEGKDEEEREGKGFKSRWGSLLKGGGAEKEGKETKGERRLQRSQTLGAGGAGKGRRGEVEKGEWPGKGEDVKGSVGGEGEGARRASLSEYWVEPVPVCLDHPRTAPSLGRRMKELLKAPLRAKRAEVLGSDGVHLKEEAGHGKGEKWNGEQALLEWQPSPWEEVQGVEQDELIEAEGGVGDSGLERGETAALTEHKEGYEGEEGRERTRERRGLADRPVSESNTDRTDLHEDHGKERAPGGSALGLQLRETFRPSGDPAPVFGSMRGPSPVFGSIRGRGVPSPLVDSTRAPLLSAEDPSPMFGSMQAMEEEVPGAAPSIRVPLLSAEDPRRVLSWGHSEGRRAWAESGTESEVGKSARGINESALQVSESTEMRGESAEGGVVGRSQTRGESREVSKRLMWVMQEEEGIEPAELGMLGEVTVAAGDEIEHEEDRASDHSVKDEEVEGEVEQEKGEEMHLLGPVPALSFDSLEPLGLEERALEEEEEEGTMETHGWGVLSLPVEEDQASTGGEGGLMLGIAGLEAEEHRGFWDEGLEYHTDNLPSPLRYPQPDSESLPAPPLESLQSSAFHASTSPELANIASAYDWEEHRESHPASAGVAAVFEGHASLDVTHVRSGACIGAFSDGSVVSGHGITGEREYLAQLRKRRGQGGRGRQGGREEHRKREGRETASAARSPLGRPEYAMQAGAHEAGIAAKPHEKDVGAYARGVVSNAATAEDTLALVPGSNSLLNLTLPGSPHQQDSQAPHYPGSRTSITAPAAPAQDSWASRGRTDTAQESPSNSLVPYYGAGSPAGLPEFWSGGFRPDDMSGELRPEDASGELLQLYLSTGLVAGGGYRYHLSEQAQATSREMQHLPLAALPEDSHVFEEKVNYGEPFQSSAGPLAVPRDEYPKSKTLSDAKKLSLPHAPGMEPPSCLEVSSGVVENKSGSVDERERAWELYEGMESDDDPEIEGEGELTWWGGQRTGEREREATYSFSGSEGKKEGSAAFKKMALGQAWDPQGISVSGNPKPLDGATGALTYQPSLILEGDLVAATHFGPDSPTQTRTRPHTSSGIRNRSGITDRWIAASTSLEHQPSTRHGLESMPSRTKSGVSISHGSWTPAFFSNMDVPCVKLSHGQRTPMFFFNEVAVWGERSHGERGVEEMETVNVWGEGENGIERVDKRHRQEWDRVGGELAEQTGSAQPFVPGPEMPLDTMDPTTAVDDVSQWPNDSNYSWDDEAEDRRVSKQQRTCGAAHVAESPGGMRGLDHPEQGIEESPSEASSDGDLCFEVADPQADSGHLGGCVNDTLVASFVATITKSLREGHTGV